MLFPRTFVPQFGKQTGLKEGPTLSNLSHVMQLANDRARIRFLNEQTPKAMLPEPRGYRVLDQRQSGSGRLMSPPSPGGTLPPLPADLAFTASRILPCNLGFPPPLKHKLEKGTEQPQDVPITEACTYGGKNQP